MLKANISPATLICTVHVSPKTNEKDPNTHGAGLISTFSPELPLTLWDTRYEIHVTRYPALHIRISRVTFRYEIWCERIPSKLGSARLSIRPSAREVSCILHTSPNKIMSGRRCARTSYSVCMHRLIFGASAPRLPLTFISPAPLIFARNLFTSCTI